MVIGIAGIAQLVERNLAKVEVAGSSPVSRSRSANPGAAGVFAFGPANRLGGRVVMQRTANPRTSVQFRPEPPVSRYMRKTPYWAIARPSGEIGRRTGLKILWPQGRAGSTPASGTNVSAP